VRIVRGFPRRVDISTTFVNHIVYQIALDVYRILNDLHALLATRSPRPVEVKTALPDPNPGTIDRSWTPVVPRCPHEADPLGPSPGLGSLRAVSFAQQSTGGPPRT
jgi:hypothetical protein